MHKIQVLPDECVHQFPHFRFDHERGILYTMFVEVYHAFITKIGNRTLGIEPFPHICFMLNIDMIRQVKEYK